MRAARYTGKPKTRQLGGGNWLEPGAVITEPPALVEAFLECSDFEVVDISMLDAEQIAPADDGEVVDADYDYDREDEE